jgi:hypothetical protein
MSLTPSPEVPSLPRPPVCAACGKVMRLQGSMPAPHFDNLDEFEYVCDCGATSEKVVPHQD